MASIFLLFFLLFVTSKGENRIDFFPGSSMLTMNRDGILTVLLGSGEKATVCNKGFTDIYANKACGAMGYPMKGITLLTKRLKLVKDLKMVAIKCNGAETDLRSCSIINDGRMLRECEARSMVAHVLCLEEKIKPMVQNYRTITRCSKTHEMVQLVPVEGKTNTGFLQIKASGENYFRFVCNKYLNFGLSEARLFCSLLCENPANARPVMYMDPGSMAMEGGYYKDMTCAEDATSISQCEDITKSTACEKVYNVALQCGEEIKKEDPPPNVICSNRSMIIEWSKKQTFYLNSSLVILHSNHTEDCLYSRTENKDNVVIKIPLDYCNPIITDHDTTITFKYNIVRMYTNDGVVQFKTKETIDVFCEIPKLDEIAKEYAHGDITYPPVLSGTSLKVVMTLHSGSEFRAPLPMPYDIQFYTTVFVKVAISNPLKQIKLSLRNCLVSSARSYTEINALNSAKIIDENCPVAKYNVQIIPVNKWSIAFQFTSFKLAESNRASVNIYCETVKCMIIDDPECGICMSRNQRKKRSASFVGAHLIRVGPISLH